MGGRLWPALELPGPSTQAAPHSSREPQGGSEGGPEVEGLWGHHRQPSGVSAGGHPAAAAAPYPDSTRAREAGRGFCTRRRPRALGKATLEGQNSYPGLERWGPGPLLGLLCKISGASSEKSYLGDGEQRQDLVLLTKKALVGCLG